ncbi:hypothetical protein C9374_006783 [Naegleria lovaniensis]|uniref:Uncharacterized protein n=1 Tax=Naegleria lovaniensis TaxID=51637 RepID=A0AA88GM81_NAELO|nr:uncharacterized protein C9374_006783 [Naegleria lovaniensis]KAG2379666.1 hypothetical protein C9374_006783 [Naegleria lovaniensis]
MQQQAFYPMPSQSQFVEASFNYQHHPSYAHMQQPPQQPRKYIVPEQQTPFQADPTALYAIMNNQQPLDPYSNQSARYSYVPGGSSNPKTPGKSPYSTHHNHQFMMNSNLNKENDHYNNMNYNYSLNSSTYAYQQSMMQPKTPGKSTMNASFVSSTAITPGRTSLRKESLCKTGEKKFLHTPKRATASVSNNTSKPKTPHQNTSLLNTSSMSFNNNNTISTNSSLNNSSMMTSNNTSNRSSKVSSNQRASTNTSQQSKRTLASVKENDRKSQRSLNSQTSRQSRVHNQPPRHSLVSAPYSKRVNTSSNDGVHGFLTSTASSSTLVFDNCDTSNDDAFMMNTTLNSSQECSEQDICRFLNAQLQRRSKNDLKEILERYIEHHLVSHNNSIMEPQGTNDSLFSSSVSSNASVYEMESEETTGQEVDSASTLTQASTFTAPSFNAYHSVASNGSCNTSSGSNSQQISNLTHSSSRTSVYSHSGLNSSFVRYEPSDLIKRLLKEEEQRCQVISHVAANAACPSSTVYPMTNLPQHYRR